MEFRRVLFRSGAVSAWAGPRRLRSRLARVARRRRAVVGAVDRRAESGLAGGVRPLEDALRRRARRRLPLGGWRVREGRPREGQGRDARGPGGVARWPEGDPGRREWLSGIDGELGGPLARSQAARALRADAGRRRR